jgi:acetylornithine/N-succinyldiaminopimelate aminotransferase
MNSQEVFELDRKFVAQTYGRQPVAIAKGRNDIVWDLEGKKYIDCFAGLAVCNLGHAHPKIAKAIATQAKKLLHCSNLYYTQEQAELAQELAKITPQGLDKFFFCNSGTEAVEAAIKLAKRHAKKTGFIAMKGAFHGRTQGALSATWTEKYRKPFEPLLPDFTFVEYGNIAEAEKAITENTAAILV